ncbi:hypothetical protein F5Y07DRAFT_400536 [Xylaria sp. FL0933]|nr:hypothetical protein F5Y07DRAFT_400536 [Xylaria sp. FL0933]
MTQRTQDSMVFGVAARDLRSSFPRFNWNRMHEYAFYTHITTHIEVDTMYNDMGLLLRWLNLDGYEDVVNDIGENVHKLIIKKVKEKILKSRRRAGLSSLPDTRPGGEQSLLRDTSEELEQVLQDATDEEDEEPLPDNIDPRLLIRQRPPAQLRPARLQ